MAAFPWNAVTVLIETIRVAKVVLRGQYIFRTCECQTVVENNPRLKRTDKFKHFFRLAGDRINIAADIKPEFHNLAEFSQEFPHLVAHVFGVTAHVAGGIQSGNLRRRQMIQCVIGIFRNKKIGMMPIGNTVVQSDPYAFSAKGVYEFLENVTATRGIGYFIVGEFSIPHTKTVAVLGNKYNVFHPGITGRLCPFGRIKKVGVEIVNEKLVVLLRNALVSSAPLVYSIH